MKLNQPITSTKNNLGLVSLVGGLLQVIFGFGLSFVALVIFAVTLGAGIRSLVSEKYNTSRTAMAKIGISLVVVMAILYFALGTTGIVGFFL